MSKKVNHFHISKEELRKMSEVDIRTVNPEGLVDIVSGGRKSPFRAG